MKSWKDELTKSSRPARSIRKTSLVCQQVSFFAAQAELSCHLTSHSKVAKLTNTGFSQACDQYLGHFFSQSRHVRVKVRPGLEAFLPPSPNPSSWGGWVYWPRIDTDGILQVPCGWADTACFRPRIAGVPEEPLKPAPGDSKATEEGKTLGKNLSKSAISALLLQKHLLRLSFTTYFGTSNSMELVGTLARNTTWGWSSRQQLSSILIMLTRL